MDRVRATVVFALPERQWSIDVELEAGSSVGVAVERSGICRQVPQLQGVALEAGIFHRRCTLDAPVRDGDRIEIFRPLQIDPKEARRQRAASRKR